MFLSIQQQHERLLESIERMVGKLSRTPCQHVSCTGQPSDPVGTVFNSPGSANDSGVDVGGSSNAVGRGRMMCPMDGQVFTELSPFLQHIQQHTVSLFYGGHVLRAVKFAIYCMFL
jgi:hypothetical protein